ncbi:MAG: hypothetical protein CMP76_01300 [Flavobacterium sp.]|uniref:fibronectin type III domain-containing protein n=1 Tax=Flavobacterium sp. TaxID=239 RepID=UPI000C4054FC|nr:fibronectin type III domain-containing protein [Flavobacterium sp.]MBF01910.1 hypothetical protein [Flavobacterium sp.]
MKKLLLFFMSLVTFIGYSQLPENFEGTFPPTGWAVFTSGSGTSNWNVTTAGVLVYPDGGTQSAYIARENVGQGNTSYKWMVTPAITGLNANSELRFQTRQQFVGNSGTIFELRYSTTSQTDINSFTTLQTWDENQLNSPYDQYNEKVVDISSLAAFPNVYFAFVKVHTQTGTTTPTFGDGWLIDAVRLTEACLPPSAPLSEINITSTSVELSLTTNGSATQWEVEIYPNGGSPTGSGVIVNSMPFTISGLIPNTTYELYIRSVCSGGVTSAWVGPFNTQTLPQGLDCSDPIQITTVPYSTTDNTNVYGNDFNGPQGSSCAGGSTNYLAGNDVVYEFIPTFTGNVSIISTPVEGNSSLFVYSSCANIGVTCLAGVANTNNAPREINGFSVTAGQSYFIVVSSSAVTTSINYNLVIQRESCAPPTNLGINNLSNTSVDLSWDNPSGATSWEVVNQPVGGGIPSGSGTQTNNNTAYTVTGLTPGTNYEYWVRADCNDGTFSTWAGPYTYMTTLCLPTEQCNYIFELWDTGSNGWQGNTMNVSQNGTVVAVLTGPEVSDGTNHIQVSVPLCNNQPFVLYWNPTGTSPAQVGVSIIEPTANNVIYTKAPGTGTQNSQLFNGVAQCTPPTCPQPNNIVVSNVNSNSASVNWSDNAGATQWEVIVQPAGTGYPGTGVNGTLTSTRPFTVTGLNSNTQYEVYVRAICSGSDSSVWSGPIPFRTTPDYCAGDHFYDTGGAAGNYGNDESNVFTICPDASGNVVSIVFNAFNTQAGNDVLEVFNGPNVSGTLLGAFSGSNLPPNLTSSHPGGCLTFRFNSNGATTALGWDISVTCGPPPACPAPISLSLISINEDEFTVGWNETGSATQWEIIYLPAGSAPPSASDTGTIVNSNPATIVGAAAGFYDVYVRAICGPGNISAWSSIPVNFYVVAGLQACAGVEIDTANNGVIEVCSTDNCVDLSASFFQTGNTSVYKVDPIAFAPPFPFTGGTPLNISTDDIWSGNIPLPFDFCFFGTNYNQCSVGSNGVVTFNSTTANQFCNWSFNQQIPNTGFPIKNAIYGVYQDINPAVTTPPAMPDINYQVLGSAPCRVFVFNISNVAQFSCNTNVPLQTSQIVMYETSNVIEVYVLNRVPCTSWQSGVGVIGIQNNAGTLAYTPPGRNTGAWSASNEGWRFTPDGAPNVTFSWLKDGQFYSADTDINVCINASTTMTAQAIYTSCNGQQTVTSQNVLLNYTNEFEPTFTPIDPICNGESVTLPTASLEGVTGSWTPDTVDNTQTTEYIFTPDPGQCARPTSLEIIVRDQVTPSFIQPAPICAGDVAPVLPTTSDNGVTGSWSPSVVDNMTSGQYTFTPDSGQCGLPFVMDITVLPACELNIIATAVNIQNCETTGSGEYFNVTGNGTDLIGPSGNVFPNSDLGTYVQNSGSLILNGGELRTHKGTSSNICSVEMKYRIYEVSATPGAFTSLALPLLDDCNAGSFPSGGTCDPGDQKWNAISAVVDLTTLALGNYRIDVYYELVGDYDSTTDCFDTILVDNNGSYYSAEFAIQSTPVFTYEDPTYCNATDGSITISGLNPSDGYSIAYTDDTVAVGPTTYYANLNGQIVLNGLNAGVYANFDIIINGCNIVNSSDITLVNPTITPTFNPIGPFCAGTIFSLPVNSIEGITGTWSPAVNNSQTTTYTFVPNAGQCAVNSAPYTVVINQLPFVTQVAATDFCPGSDASFTITGSPNATVDYQIGGGSTVNTTLDANGSATIVVPSPTANVVLTLSLINDGTCVNPLNNTATASILPLPTISSFVATNNLVCIGNDAQFVINGTPNSTVNYTINGTPSPAVVLDASGTYTINLTAPVSDTEIELITITNNSTSCTNTLSGIVANITIITVPVPTADLTQPTCATPTGTVEVTSPLINQLNYPSDLFISEVTDAQPGSLSYIEIYNGTGASVDLSNYKLKVYTNGNPTASCDMVLSGTLANDDVVVVKLSSSANEGGVVPDLTFTTCSGFNNNDQVVLTTIGDVELDVWGINGTPFTPSNGIGYNYQRIATGTTLPSIVWNPADWNAVDWPNPTSSADYSTVGSYTLFVASYEYVLNDGTNDISQTTTTFANLVPGDYTLVAYDTAAGCYSEPLQITIDQPSFNDPIVTFTYGTPVCEDSGNLLPDTSATGFTTGGTFSSTTGLSIDSLTGEIDVVNSTPGSYVVTYTVIADPGNCLNAASATFTLVINSRTTATFAAISLCEGSLSTTLPSTSLEGYTGTWDAANIDTSMTGSYTYTFTPDAGQCADVGTLSVMIDPRDMPTFNPIADLCSGSLETELPSTSLEGYTGTWSPSAINTSVVGVATYTFTPDAQFCATSTTLDVTIKGCTIPKGFSPNGDGNNDTWDLSTFNVKKVEVFNRYGLQVYSKNDYTNEWGGKQDNGNELPSGTYYYTIEFYDRESVTGWVYINKGE